MSTECWEHGLVVEGLFNDESATWLVELSTYVLRCVLKNIPVKDHHRRGNEGR